MSKSYRRVKHATADAVEDPDIGSDGCAEGGGDVEQAVRRECSRWVVGVVGDDGGLGSEEGEEEEHECSAELAQYDN